MQQHEEYGLQQPQYLAAVQRLRQPRLRDGATRMVVALQALHQHQHRPADVCIVLHAKFELRK